MEKRVFVAIGVSIAFLWVWAALAPKLFPQLERPRAVARKAAPVRPLPNRPSSEAPAAAPARAAEPGGAPPPVPVYASSEQFTEVQTPNFVARFSNRGAQLVSFKLRKYLEKDRSASVDLVKQRPPSRTDYPFAIEAADGRVTRSANAALYSLADTTAAGLRTLQYRYVGSDGLSITKTFRIQPEYLIGFEVAISPAIPYRVVIGPGLRTLSGSEEDNRIIVTGNGVVQRDGKSTVLPREKGDRFRSWDDAQFVGIEDNYFLTAIRAERASSSVLRRVDLPAGKTTRKDLYAGVTAAPNGIVSGVAFLGPKETKLLDRLGFGSVLQFGWFGVIARFLLTVLVWINQFTRNYGFAIIILTILIKVILYPLQHKSIVSMKKMQKAQPKMEAIKNKYKKARSDPEQRQKMNVEMMKLYQAEGINPMSGCVPILLQLPILWGFYGLLSQAIELRGAPFVFWIRDLSEKDPYYITPLLMTATMFIQTYITPSTGDPAQRRIFLAMPIVFGWIFKEFPSGLVLYWLVQNVLTIVQQSIMNKWWKDHPEEIQKA